MLKNISNLGTELSKAEQKQVNGGIPTLCCNPAFSCCKGGRAGCYNFSTPAQGCM